MGFFSKIKETLDNKKISSPVDKAIERNDPAEMKLLLNLLSLGEQVIHQAKLKYSASQTGQMVPQSQTIKATGAPAFIRDIADFINEAAKDDLSEILSLENQITQAQLRISQAQLKAMQSGLEKV